MDDDWIKTTHVSAGTFSFEPPVTDAVQFNIRGEAYMLPAVEHEQYDVIASLCAIVVKLHTRVEALEVNLAEALQRISLGSQNSMTSKEALGREARAALAEMKGQDDE